jgi:HSP20 family molecular chaperone IbpA
MVMFRFGALRPVSRDEVLGPVQRQLDRMLNEAFGHEFLEGVKNNSNFPRLDAYTTKDGLLVVKMAVAGYPAESINVQVLPDGILEVSGSAKSDAETTEEQYHIRELTSGSFNRRLRLPDNVAGDPKAEMKDGILTLSFPLQLPEEEKEPEVKKIPITVA